MVACATRRSRRRDRSALRALHSVPAPRPPRRRRRRRRRVQAGRVAALQRARPRRRAGAASQDPGRPWATPPPPRGEERETPPRDKYTLLRMTKRVEARPLPDVEIIDLRQERGEKEDKGFVIFSKPLKSALRTTFDAGEQG